MNKLVGLVMGVAVVSCHHPKSDEVTGTADRPPVARSSAEVDALWDLAPVGTTFGMVMSPHGMKTAEGAYANAKLIFGNDDPEHILHEIEREMPATSFDQLGMSAQQGLAYFELNDRDRDRGRGEVWVLPVFSREKFVAAMKGSSTGDVDTIGRFKCQRLSGQYTCSRKLTPEQIADRSTMRTRVGKAGARGDLEIVGVEDGKDIVMTASYDDGTIRMHSFVGSVPEALHVFDKVVAPKPDLAGATGFATVDLRPLLAAAPDADFFGLDFRTLAKALKGPITLTMMPGPATARLRAPLADSAPIDSLLAACPALGAVVPQVTAETKNGGCHVTVANSKIDVVAKVVNKELVIELGGAVATNQDVPTSPYAKELADGTWTFAAWGRGSILAESMYPLQAVMTAVGKRDAKNLQSLIRLAELVDEGGVGFRVEPDGVRVDGFVRTAWADGPELAAKRMAISASEVIDGSAVAKAKGIADGAPKSRFAADLAAGQSGLVLGSLVTVGLPVVLDESRVLKKKKQSEAMLQLTKIMKNEKTLFISTSSYSKGNVGPTPAQTCCGQQGNRCHSVPADWATPGWQEIDFQIDEPNLFQYTVKSDGQTVTATAVGDLDCDGIYVTYELHMDTSADGNPAFQIVEPPPNSD